MTNTRDGDLGAIETEYNGYLFRNGLQARWAVFFDNLDIEWEYEPNGYKLPDGTWHLPDFWLSTVSMWAVVKPVQLTDKEMNKAVSLAERSNHPVLLLIGPPENKPYFALEYVDRIGLQHCEYCLTNYHNYPRDEGRFYSMPGCDDDSYHEDTAHAADVARSKRFENN